MEQYIEIKSANPDCLLFYRMGDFYEMFFDDAEVASRALGIALTKRGKHLGQDIPMCGVPIHAADDYLQKLIALGHRVAVCEQMEDPAEAKKRGSKSVVRRDVVRLVTPGTLTEETLLDGRRSNFLAALARVGAAENAAFGLAWIDISTGVFRVAETQAATLAGDLARIEPREILVSDQLLADESLRDLLRGLGPSVTPVPRATFDGATAAERIGRYFAVATLDGFGAFSRAELAAASGALAYVERTQVGSRPPLDPPRRESAAETMAIDAATRANLELTRTLAGERRGSLAAAIDRTITAAGARLLVERMASPLTDPDAIGRRLDAVGFFLDEPERRGAVRAVLAAAPDISRSLSRLALDRGGPRDLGHIAAALAASAGVAGSLASADAPAEIAFAAHALAALPADLAETLAAALADELPFHRRDGGFIRPGFLPDLDEARGLRDESRRVVAALQADYAAETGVKSLKIRHNAVLGWFIEVAQAHGEKILAENAATRRFIHRQTLAGAVRFTTTELADLETRIASAADRALGLEIAAFDDLVARVLAAAPRLKAAAEALAIIDVSAALAEIAEREAYVRPKVDRSLAFRVRGGRHPVVEQALRAEGRDPFVANDCDLGPVGSDEAGRLVVLTGPNMGGKSTFLRQNALIAVLAQMGSYVPAAEVEIGVVDRLFSRVGAADDLARGRSTFMVEMVETAAILNQAGPRALVVLDEIGRGTATYDGLSIAWGTIEHLHAVNRCRTLFATHYHELTGLADRLPRVVNATVRVREWKGDVVFLHEIVPGAADRSYGIQVARLAGLPEAVITRAKSVLAKLEAADRQNPRAAVVDDLPLFQAVAPRAAAPAAPDPALTVLDGLDPDAMSPREALDALYRLKAERARAAKG
ncbi:DNA mismatch repair protein MutS [Segnochrobactrum spirostomi]|uniref:DNA mismatch repair protein MutS n=1 Tax=Segnochrobactrum spirostomi TaxID=2608987 RepID=A0A6A7Y4U8_9HYPH|nr:DNA mismatch repair protein MutS [Segnochrobactrum spirostomi]MQT13121.1 DNA mismatch repair protein MutS [Segnochrobactrum spirostomi]